MAGPLREILAQFTINVDGKPLDDANEKLDKAKEKAGGVGGALTKIGAAVAGTFALGAIKGFLEDQINLGSAIKDTSERLGVGTDELQQFQYAAKLSGVSGEEAANSLGHLNKAIGDATGGGEAAKAFTGIGVAIKDVNGQTRPTLDVLADLADHFAETDDPAKKAALSMQVLGRSGQQLIPVLNQGGDEIRRLFGEANDLGGVLGKDFIEQADAAGDQIDRFGFALEGVKATIALAVLPTLTSLVTTFTSMAADVNVLAKNTTLLETGFIGLGVALGVAAIAAGIIDLELIVMVLSVIAVVVVVAILYLAFDDLYNLFKGNKSVMGDVLDWFIGVGARKAEIDGVKESIDGLGTSLEQIGIESGGLGKAFGELTDGMAKDAVKSFIAILRIIELVSDALKFVIDVGASAGRTLSGKSQVVDGKEVGHDTPTFHTNAFRPLADIAPGSGTASDLDNRVRDQKITNTFNVQVDGAGKDGKQIGHDIATGTHAQLGNRPKTAATVYGGGR
jgi:hypothetical protein